MDLKTLVQPENLNVFAFENFQLKGCYGEEELRVFFTSCYEEGGGWNIGNVSCENLITGIDVECQKEYEKEQKKYDGLIQRHSHSFLVEAEQILLSLKKLAFSHCFQIEFYENGSKRIVFEQEKAYRESFCIWLTDENKMERMLIKNDKTKYKPYFFVQEDMEWFDNIDEFRTFLFTESKDRLRLLVQ